MKVLHCSDLHFQNDQDILKDIIKCSGFLLDIAAQEKPDLSLIAGDIFDDKYMLDSVAVKEAIRFVLGLADISPVLIVRGTYSHDHDSLHVFSKLKSRHPIYLAESVEQVAFNRDGFRQYDGFCLNLQALISCLPSVSKTMLHAYLNLDVHSSNIEAANLLRDVFQGWGLVNRNARALGIPTIIVGHGSLTGTTLSTGQQMVGRDLEFGAGDIAMAEADIVCLGHIHKTQRHKNIFYAGSITRLNFGETEDKGFLTCEINGGKLTSRFIKTPARKMLTVNINSIEDIAAVEGVEGACVKIHYEVPEEKMHTINNSDIRDILSGKGVSSVSIQKTVIPKQRVRAAGISQVKSLEDKVKKWAETVEEKLPKSVLDKIAFLDKNPDEIIAAYADDGKTVINATEEEIECDLFMQNLAVSRASREDLALISLK